MASRNNRTNSFIKWTVLFLDFVMLNCLLRVFRCEHPVMSSWAEDRADLFTIVCNLAMALAMIKFSTRIHRRVVRGHEILLRGIAMTVTQTVLAYLIMKMMDWTLPVGWLLLSIGGCELVIVTVRRFTERGLVARLRALGRNSRSVTLVGSDSELLALHRNLIGNPSLGYRVRGYYGDEELQTEEGRPEEQKADIKRLGTLEELIVAVNRDEAVDLGDEVYVCLPRREREKLWALSSYCDSHVVRFYYVPPSVERLGMKLRRELIGEMEIYSTYKIPLENPVNRYVKRAFDIVVSVVALLVTLLLFPIVALVILIQSPGPIFFSQERTGMNGKKFLCYKFRSMHVNKDADRLQATENDPRKFPFGNIMRKFNIDELPQFWNVLVGDMSVVGPRPHMLMHTEYYSHVIVKFMVRHFVKPGITGWAQVTGYRGETKELWQMRGRVKRDIWYIEHWSIWLDMKIVWMTFIGFFVPDKKAY